MSLHRNEGPFLPQIGISAAQAAEAVGISPSTFHTMVADGRMPRPKLIGSRKVWDVEEIRAAFKALPYDQKIDEQDTDTWADVAVR